VPGARWRTPMRALPAPRRDSYGPRRDDIIGSPCTSATSRSKVPSAPAKRLWPSGSAHGSTRHSCSKNTTIPFWPTSTRIVPGAALQAQLFYLLSRHRQQTALRQADLFSQITISDYLFDRDKIFAYLNLDDNELFIYQRLYDLLARDAPPPDLVIYLQTPTDVLLRRIRSRDAGADAAAFNPDPEYLKELNEAYHHFFFHYTATPLLVVEPHSSRPTRATRGSTTS
jgi:hypothetical protein